MKNLLLHSQKHANNNLANGNFRVEWTLPRCITPWTLLHWTSYTIVQSIRIHMFFTAIWDNGLSAAMPSMLKIWAEVEHEDLNSNGW